MIQLIRKIFPLIVCAATACLLFSFYSGEDPLQRLLAKFEYVQKNYPQEKVYTHFDKAYYYAGDTIYFKAYITNAEGNKQNVVSNILHLDITDENNVLLQTLQYPASEGLAWGSIATDDLKAGVLQIHAYTNWMRNFDEACFFEQQLFIGELPGDRSASAAVRAPVIDSPGGKLYFFPEGGQLVNGLQAKIGFKSVGANGLGVPVTGSVTDQQGKNIAAIKSGFAGIGSFQLTPAAGAAYFANLQYADGRKKTMALPKANPDGYQLSVDNDKAGDLSIRINGSQDVINKPVTLIVQSNNSIQHVAKNVLAANGTFISLSTDRFPTGVLQLTLFNAAFQPVAERLVFIDHQDQLQVKVTSDKNVYDKREKIQLFLDAADDAGNPVSGSFSVSVTDMKKVPENSQAQNILSQLLLAADLANDIENPGYYFSAITTQKQMELDNLLLTRSWKKFAWKDVLADKYGLPAYTAEESLHLGGKVFTTDGKPAKNATVTFVAKNGNFVADTVTNQNGEFQFDRLYFNDTIDFTVLAKDGAGKSNLKIVLDSIPPQHLYSKKSFIPEGAFNDSLVRTYMANPENKRSETTPKSKKHADAKVLKEVVVREKKLTPAELATKSSLNLNGAGNADQVVTYKDLESCHEVPNCLASKLVGVQLRTVNKHVFAFSNRRLNANTRMLVIRDGIQMTDESADLSAINVYDIQSIEVLRSGARLNVYGPAGASGVLVITTKNGSIDYNSELSKSDLNVSAGITGNLKGYYASREFYSPDYENTNINSTTPDMRSTVFWIPNVLTDENGKGTMSFFNTDGPGKYRVVVEGISRDGKPGRQVFYYEVK